MSYLVISFSHKNIDIKQREKLAFNDEDKKDRFIKQLIEFENTKEVEQEEIKPKSFFDKFKF